MPTRRELEITFQELGVDTRYPGFYDDPAFVAEERRNPAFLKMYAHFVETSIFDDEYLNRVRQVVRELSDFLLEQLRRDGRRGACIDISGTLMRMLEIEGVWNYMAEGAAVLNFPPQTGLPTKYYWPIMHPDNPATAGHTWIRVPPFKVVDLSLPVQLYSAAERRYFQNFVAEEEWEAAQTNVMELMENEAIDLFVLQKGRLPTIDDVARIAPEVQITIQEFPPFEVRYAELTLKYVTTRVSAMDAPLDRMRNLCLSGQYPIDLYNEILRRRRRN